nr:unnamed protein product [Spirometra erinaceieuropaei]
MTDLLQGLRSMPISPSKSSGFNLRQADTPEQLDALVSALGDNTYRHQLMTMNSGPLRCLVLSLALIFFIAEVRAVGICDWDVRTYAAEKGPVMLTAVRSGRYTSGYIGEVPCANARRGYGGTIGWWAPTLNGGRKYDIRRRRPGSVESGNFTPAVHGSCELTLRITTPCIPKISIILLDLAIETIELLLQSKYDETENHLGHAQILQLLKLCHRTYFTFDWTINEQVKGTPMGSPISGFIAEAVLQRLESLVFQHHRPKFWARYVDDTFVVIERDQVLTFQEHLNAVFPDIQFTMEEKENNQLAFLDVLASGLPAAYKVLRHHNRRAQDQTTTPDLRRQHGDSPTLSLQGEEEQEPPVRPPD